MSERYASELRCGIENLPGVVDFRRDAGDWFPVPDAFRRNENSLHCRLLPRFFPIRFAGQKKSFLFPYSLPQRAFRRNIPDRANRSVFTPPLHRDRG